MNDFLLYLLNSTICLSVLYLLFRVLLRKETNFKLNRIILLSIVLSSLVIPKLILPGSIHKPLDYQMIAAFSGNGGKLPGKLIDKTEEVKNNYPPEKINNQFTVGKILLYGYMAGFITTLLVLVYGLFSVIRLCSKAESRQMEGYRLLIVRKEIPAFSLGHLVLLSRHDYENHPDLILAHEKEHIRLRHFYDLIFLEVVKIFQWFNPLIYWLIRDLKDIHEFQADHQTLIKGIDVAQYQLLIIQKSVGHQRFALANNFNHCQIKNRIVMMNKQKSGKAWRWKVAIFLPLLALLLLTFCKSGEKTSSANQSGGASTSIVGTWQLVSYKYGAMEKAASPGFVAIELITPTHFTWVHYGTNNTVFSSAGGTYTFDGENFTPNVEFGASGMLPYLGKSHYKIRIEGDQMFLSGNLNPTGLKLEEVWKKL